jgi:hypothetical protein
LFEDARSNPRTETSSPSALNRSDSGDLDREALAIPSRVFCNSVIGDRKSPPFRRRKSGDNDNGDRLETKLFCRRVAAMSGDELKVLAHRQRAREAEGDDTVGDLADLLAGCFLAFRELRLIWLIAMCWTLMLFWKSDVPSQSADMRRKCRKLRTDLELQ